MPPVNLRVNQHNAGSTSGTNNFVNDATYPSQSIGSAPISVTDLADYQSIELRYMCSTSMVTGTIVLRGHTPEHTARQPPLYIVSDGRLRWALGLLKNSITGEEAWF